MNKLFSSETYVDEYLAQAQQIINHLDRRSIEGMVNILLNTRKSGGRLFILGIGGSAGNASHAVNDFRKIAGIESYTPTDNVSELTARVNDDGWDSSFVNWLMGSRINFNDCVLIFSVGGGDVEKNISNNLVQALKYAKEIGAKITGIVGKEGGYTAQVADVVVIVPVISSETITAHSEAFQAVIWHLVVTHPLLKINALKWESVK